MDQRPSVPRNPFNRYFDNPKATTAVGRARHRSHLARAIDKMPFEVHPSIDIDTFDADEARGGTDFLSLRPEWLH
jgi:hypothetical protein